MAGFIQGVRFYANHLYRKNFVQMIRSILDTKDTEESRPLEYEESVILYTLKGFGRLQEERDEMAQTIARLNRELAQTKERAKTNETHLKERIKDSGFSKPSSSPISATDFLLPISSCSALRTRRDRFQSLKLWPVLDLIRREQWETEKPK